MLMLIPAIGISQSKIVLNSSRYFPKTDKIEEFEKALANHAQKYHTGDWKWRVWSIRSGPDAGGYMITEGPNNWETLDTRGDISTEHTTDWTKNVAPLTTSQGSSGYDEFQANLSTVQLTDFSDKIVINHMTAKPGKISALKDLIVKLKKVWQFDSLSVAVYLLVASGDPGYVTATRLKAGLKELAEGYRKSTAESFNTVYGAGSWDAFMKDYADAVEKRWSEILIYKPSLSSK